MTAVWGTCPPQLRPPSALRTHVMRCGSGVTPAREGSCAQVACSGQPWRTAARAPAVPAGPEGTQTGGSALVPPPQAALGPATHECSPGFMSGGLITDSSSDRASAWVQRGAQPPPPAHSALNYSSVPLKHRKSSGFLENVDVTDHFERCFVRQCFNREIHAQPLPKVPQGQPPQAGLPGVQSLPARPGTGGSPPPRGPLAPPTSSQVLHHPARSKGALFWEASFTCSGPAGLGQGRGSRGMEAGIVRPTSSLPFLWGTRRCMCMLTDRQMGD